MQLVRHLKCLTNLCSPIFCRMHTPVKTGGNTTIQPYANVYAPKNLASPVFYCVL